jgi:hypothetical protein
MKSYILLLPLLFSISCMKQNEELKETGELEQAASSRQISAEEVKSINITMNNDTQYQLTKDEYKTLLASGLLSESEKEELEQFFQ